MDIQTIIQHYELFANAEIPKNMSLKDYLLQWTQLKAECEEYFAKTYIANSCDTQNEQKAKAYTEAIDKMEILSPLSHKIEKKIVDHYKNTQQDMVYALKLLDNNIRLYNEENTPLETQESKLSQEYQAHIGSLTIEHEGKIIPLSMARPLLEKPDRELRRTIFEKLSTANNSVAEDINQIFQKQVQLRDTIAKNVHQPHYRDYMHLAKARFDYTPKDCLEFSHSILMEIVPITQKLHKKRQMMMGLSALAPFDTAVDPENKAPLAPATSEEEFLEKCIAVLESVSPEVSGTLKRLRDTQHLDLFSRLGKAPGGYNYPLSLSKTSFIFMNSALTHQDAVTLFHETGHAYHFDLYKNEDLPFLYKNPSSEIAELASMSMELMSMEYWDILYPNPEDCKRAKRQQLEGIMTFFPWMAVVDSFQQWIYLNPQSSIEERNHYFVELYKKFVPGISWEGYEKYLPTAWHKQLHIIEVPFYYIEYGIAQLGALQIWKMYKEDPQLAFETYKKALSYASKGPISEAYAQAGIPINFSKQHIAKLMQFVQEELDKL